MNIEKRIGAVTSNGRTEVGPHREIRDEMPVHHIEMEEIGSGFEDGAAFLSDAAEVGGENGRGNERAVGSGFEEFVSWF